MTNLKLHPKQGEVFLSDKRFKVVPAGRRAGKTFLAMAHILKWAVDPKLMKRDIYYVAPTFTQGTDIFWDDFLELAGDNVKEAHINKAIVTLKNGVKIHVKGSDRPDTLRGKGLRGLVIDEYADMKPDVWESILRPTLSQGKSPALFIGTPKKRNHFYRLKLQAELNASGEWGCWTFTTADNPHIDREEIEAARRDMSSMTFAQEYEASFETSASGVFLPEWYRQAPEAPKRWQSVVAVDLAGFDAVELQSSSKNRNLDKCAITSAWIEGDQWIIKNIDYGRWTIEETAIRIIAACKEIGTTVLGIEKGLALMAISSALTIQMKLQNWYVHLVPLTHGNTRKEDRIVLALQAGLEKGRIKFLPGQYETELRDQLTQFPSSGSHDDLVDSLSMVAQLQHYGHSDAGYIDDSDGQYQPLDELTGY